jgi:hypothetical protein
LSSIAKDLGISPDEGLLVAYLPELLNVLDYEIREAADTVTVYTQGVMAVEALSERERPIKWWKFKNYAREAGFNHPEPIWHGPAGDFRVQCLPDVPQPDGTNLAIRQYSRGPWITLTPEDLAQYE